MFGDRIYEELGIKAEGTRADFIIVGLLLKILDELRELRAQVRRPGAAGRSGGPL